MERNMSGEHSKFIFIDLFSDPAEVRRYATAVNRGLALAGVAPYAKQDTVTQMWTHTSPSRVS
jgi:hypothetical protein